MCADEKKCSGRGDLRDETGDHDVNTKVVVFLCVGHAGDGAAGGLEDEGCKIAEDEGEGDGSCFENRKGFAIDGDDASEAEVDCGGEESGPDCQPDEVDDEVVVVEDVVVQHDAGDVTDDFQGTTTEHGY